MIVIATHDLQIRIPSCLLSNIAAGDHSYVRTHTIVKCTIHCNRDNVPIARRILRLFSKEFKL